jgi:hypothetical protein
MLTASFLKLAQGKEDIYTQNKTLFILLAATYVAGKFIRMY